MSHHSHRQTISRPSPVLHSVEGFLIGNVIHEDEAHGTPVVGCGDCPVALLPSSVLHSETFLRICRIIVSRGQRTLTRHLQWICGCARVSKLP